PKGGGIDVVLGPVTITNSTIGDQNRATTLNATGKGGGIYVGFATVNLTNSTVAANYSDNGGGIHVSRVGTLNTTSATIAFNNATLNGGGVYIATGATVNTVNTAFVQSSAVAGPDVFGTVTTFGCNLVNNSAGSSGF